MAQLTTAQLTGLDVPLSIAQGGTGANTTATIKSSLGFPNYIRSRIQFATSTSWTVPANVSSLAIEVYGAGGGGGSAGTNPNALSATGQYRGFGGVGSAGTRGLYAANTYSVTAGNSLTITIGAGGAGGANVGSSVTPSSAELNGQNGSAGGTTSVVNSTTATTLLSVTGSAGGLGGYHFAQGAENHLSHPDRAGTYAPSYGTVTGATQISIMGRMGGAGARPSDSRWTPKGQAGESGLVVIWY